MPLYLQYDTVKKTQNKVIYCYYMLQKKPQTPPWSFHGFESSKFHMIELWNYCQTSLNQMTLLEYSYIPSSAHIAIFITKLFDKREKPSTAILDDLHLFLIVCLKSISPSAALSVVLYPHLSFHLLFFHFFLKPPFLKGAIKQPEMMFVNKSFGGRGMGG